MAVRKLTAKELITIIKEEKAMFGKKAKETDAVKADEVEADEYADTLEKKEDHYAKLDLAEQKLLKQLNKIREAKMKAIK